MIASLPGSCTHGILIALCGLAAAGCYQAHGRSEAPGRVDAGPTGRPDLPSCDVGAGWSEPEVVDAPLINLPVILQPMTALVDRPGGGFTVFCVRLSNTQSRSTVFSRRISADGELLGEPTMIGRRSGGGTDTRPLATRAGNEIVVFWNTNPTLRTARVDADGVVSETSAELPNLMTQPGLPQLVERASGGAFLRVPANADSGESRLLRLDEAGRPSGASYVLPAGPRGVFPELAEWRGDAVMTWAVRRPSGRDIVRWATASWAPPIGYDALEVVRQRSAEVRPAVTLFGGLFAEVWNDEGSMLHRLDRPAPPVPLAEAPSAGSAIVSLPELTIALTARRDGDQLRDIVARRLTPAGPIGEPFVVAESPGPGPTVDRFERIVQVRADEGGNLAVAWVDSFRPTELRVRVRHAGCD